MVMIIIMVGVVTQHSNQKFLLDTLRRAERAAASSAPRAARPSTTHRSIAWRLTEAQRSSVIERYGQGESPYQLAAEFGISRQSVIALIDAAGAPRQQRQMSAEDVQRVVALYEDGKSMRAIAEMLGFNKASIWNQLHANDVQIRDSHGRTRPPSRTERTSGA